MAFPEHWTWAERMHAIRTRDLVNNRLAVPEWEPDEDEYPHDVQLTNVTSARPLDWYTEQRMLRAPAPW